MYTLYFDGACGPTNPRGHIGCGVLIKDKDNKTIYTISRQFPPERFSNLTSNNLAEYTALYLGLKWCLKHKITELHVIGDSKLVIMQMKGYYRIKQGAYVNAALETIKLRDQFLKITFEHVKRELNTEADALSGIVIDGYNSQKDKLIFVHKKKENVVTEIVIRPENIKIHKVKKPKGKDALNPKKLADYDKYLKDLMKEAQEKRHEKLRIEGNKPNKTIKNIERQGKLRRETNPKFISFGLSSNNKSKKKNPPYGRWV